MRIIGEPDYYDGTAYCRRDGVASLLVYRREDRRVTDASMRRTLDMPRARFGGSVIGADGSAPQGRLARRFGIDHWLTWGNLHVRIDACHVLFCGILHRGLVLTTATGRSPGSCSGRVRYCWSSESYEEGLAENGLMAADEDHVRWFTATQRSSSSRLFGITTATSDPTDPEGGWRIDAATLGPMGFDELLPADAALARLVSWIGDGETRIMTRGADAPRSMADSASGGR